MPDELSDIRVERVSLLAAPKRPANRLRIAVAKAQGAPGADGGDMAATKESTTELKLAATPELAKVLQAAAAAGDDEAGLEGELRGFSSAHRNAVLAMRRIFGRVKPEMAKELLSKLPGLLGLELPKAETPAGEAAGTVGEHQASAPIAASIDGIPLEPVVKADGTLNLDAVSQEKRPAAELLWKQAIRLKDMERRERLAVHVAKAAAMPRIGVAQDVGALLCEAADAMRPEAFTKLLALLQQADALVAKAGAFDELGSGRPDAGGAADALGKVRGRAEQIAKDSGGKLTHADAMSRAMAEQPELYAEYVREQRRRASAGA